MLLGQILTILFFIIISTFALRQVEGFRGNPEWSFTDSGAPNRKVAEDCQCGDSRCSGHSCGWNNSVSGDCRYRFAPDELMGKHRAFKYPHYYGYGTGSGFHYGEPYYTRTVNY